MRLYIVNNNSYGYGWSGGDKIWVELATHFRNRAEITLIGSPEAYFKLKQGGIRFIQSSPKLVPKNPYSVAFILKNTIYKTFWGCLFVLGRYFKDCWVYSVSDFYPDFLPAFLAKVTGKNVKWIAGYYLFASPPFSRNNPYKKGDFMRGLAYWLTQIISYPLIKYFADVVLVTSEPDAKKFKRSIVVKGGVELIPQLENWEKEYDAVFIGRLHPQKGVRELVEIWKQVVDMKPEAKLVIIGNGDLESEIKAKIYDYGLSENIRMMGFVDGALKNSIFMASRLVLHPAIYDSGGMASAEAMAFGLPAIGFNLPAYETYYAKGMLKVETIEEFAATICMLLEDEVLYTKYSKEARDYIKEEWHWDRRAEKVWQHLKQFCNGK